MAVELVALVLRLNLALAAAVLLVVLLRRPVRAFAGARTAYGLWALVPAAVLAALLPARTLSLPAAPAAVAAPEATMVAPAQAAARLVRATAGPAAEALRLPDLASLALALWALVALAWILVQAARQARFLAALGRLSPLDGDLGLYRTARRDLGPALVGALAPKVVLPADFAERFSPEQQAVVVAHERAHQRGGHAQANLAVALAQALCWFNPMVHLGARLLRADQELACDAEVVERHPTARRAYAEAMLALQSAPMAPPLGCHWAPRSAARLKERIAMLKRPTPARLRRLAGTGVVLALTFGAGLAAWAAQPPRPAEARAPHGSSLELIEAIRDGDDARAFALIEAGADVNGRWPGDGTPLIAAARHGRLDLARALVARGADANLPCPGDGNPLIMAAAAGDLDMVRFLVERGADVNAVVRGDETPLINAAAQGALPVVRYLVERGAEPSLAVVAPTVDGQERRSPLGMATRRGHPEVAAWLTSIGAKP
jgi:beta-lactamase regulating signal transducer with metallopeptidase domain